MWTIQKTKKKKKNRLLCWRKEILKEKEGVIEKDSYKKRGNKRQNNVFFWEKEEVEKESEREHEVKFVFKRGPEQRRRDGFCWGRKKKGEREEREAFYFEFEKFSLV